jgi:hypothetical protein
VPTTHNEALAQLVRTLRFAHPTIFIPQRRHRNGRAL